MFRNPEDNRGRKNVERGHVLHEGRLKLLGNILPGPLLGVGAQYDLVINVGHPPRFEHRASKLPLHDATQDVESQKADGVANV